jgi:hypothetical protein
MTCKYDALHMIDDVFQSMDIRYCKCELLNENEKRLIDSIVAESFGLCRLFSDSQVNEGIQLALAA